MIRLVSPSSTTTLFASRRVPAKSDIKAAVKEIWKNEDDSIAVAVNTLKGVCLIVARSVLMNGLGACRCTHGR